MYAEVIGLTTKEKLLELFENNKGIYFSGEEIAENLSVSRTAVWKAVKDLQGKGYNIDAVRNKGYSLSAQTDIISVQGIEKYFNSVCKNLKIEIVQSINSTNAIIREKAINGAPEGYTVIANMQTDGKGRRGRKFFSPADSGVYMSILLRPMHCTADQAANITTMASVAVCEAIEAVSGKQAQIKWVNDIYVSEKKVCGILTEASIGLEDGFLEYVVLGVGINVSPPKVGFPDDIKNVAGAVFTQPQSDSKNHLASEFLNRFMCYYSEFPKTDYIEEYRKRSFVVGKSVQVVSKETYKNAKVLGIDDNCRLIVEYEDGKTETLSSGEISIKL